MLCGSKFFTIHFSLFPFFCTFASDLKNRMRNQASPQHRASSLHSACTDFVTAKNRGVAQLVAFLVWDQAVAGSSPVTSTTQF